MLFQISEKIVRVMKAFTEPRIATKDIVKEPAHKSPIFRGRHEIKYELCIGCDACNKICPVDAIVMKPLPIKKPKIIPEVNLAICIFCGLCEDVCPTKPEKAIKLSGGDIEMITGGTHKDLDNFWVRVDVPEEWIEQKKREEEEKARKKKEMMAKKKAEAEAKKKAEEKAKAEATEAKKEESAEQKNASAEKGEEK
ncbi:4Fe-4S binding protein [Caminibacter pacificus]|uniref:4Fe-4S dicluster domain-containing protein n=1 Tax=Caminibacter pacificus TaxID=1424653 RepID=A0AAJ4RC80_9BACT|nr:4Fe-4S binding protein [Caminibacter pacificus]NPA88309.1 4Fe-4S dicluster domain-containing protein [Campylobacterota bacterium]QCI28868.1 4Fe-4S dicluster domain-containing protein [Caminibacter pacificus]ROR39459.1 NADH-quinone oxidoreductase subunit I [Caminibacter pacificus]